MPTNFCDPLMVEIGSLVVPIQKCVTVKPGFFEKSIIDDLENNGYDQAPVYDPESRVLWGLVDRNCLKRLLENGETLELTHCTQTDQDQWLHVGSVISVDTLLNKMAHIRAVIVVRGGDVEGYGYMEIILGLLTISDLNRHPLRSTLYSLLSHLESHLANFVSSNFNDPWEWMKNLNEESQVQVLGFWELSKRKGVDVGPIAATTLSQLLQIVSKNKDLLRKLGYKSRENFGGLTGKIPGLRNRVMHPVRPLVLGQEDVMQLSVTVKAAIDLGSRIEIEK